MNIPPLLERLLLSNEAVFKNAALGFAGQNMVLVPTGKTAVILEVSIEPFVNGIDNKAFKQLFDLGKIEFNSAYYRTLIERMMFQLQIVNDAYETRFTFHNCFSVKSNNDPTEIDDYAISVDLNFRGFREELFIYTDRSLYFNFIYPYFKVEENQSTAGFTYDYTTPAIGFLSRIQNLPTIPYSWKNATALQLLIQIIQIATDGYQSINRQFIDAIPLVNSTEYIKFLAEDTLFANALQSIAYQKPSQDSMTEFSELFSLPVINVKYALLNKRADDYGITMPPKK